MNKVGASGRLYLTKHVWVPEKPLAKLNLKIADALRKHMPPLPAQGEAALLRFPVLREFQANHDAIRAELLGVLTLKNNIPELKYVHPRDRRISSPEWRTYVMRLWGYEVRVNAARCPRTVEVCARVPGVHTVLFSILDPHSTIPRHRGWATGVVRLHYPLLVPREWHKCRIEIEDVSYPWREGEPLLFDDTYAHAVDNDTDELRVVLIVDFEPRMPLPLDAFMKLRYVLVRRSHEVRTICDRAAVAS